MRPTYLYFRCTNPKCENYNYEMQIDLYNSMYRWRTLKGARFIALPDLYCDKCFYQMATYHPSIIF